MSDTHGKPSASFLVQFTFNPAQAAFISCAERFSFYVGVI
jgi:hypothetical protein